MKCIIIRNYYTYDVVKKLKLNDKARYRSITYGVEGDRFVVRDYYTNEKLQTCKAPSCSIQFECVDDEDEE